MMIYLRTPAGRKEHQVVTVKREAEQRTRQLNQGSAGVNYEQQTEHTLMRISLENISE